MRKLLFGLLTILSLAGCSHSHEHPIPLPSKIDVEMTAEHQRIPGTKLAAIIPDGYNFVNCMGMFRKSENEFIQFVQSSNAFNKGIFDTLKKTFNDGSTNFKDVSMNSFDGFLSEEGSEETNENFLSLSFGNGDFSVQVTGKSKFDQTKDRNDLIGMMESIVYDESHIVDHSDLYNFNFDQNICGFKIVKRLNHVLMLSENGVDPFSTKLATSFSINCIEAVALDEMKTYMESMLRMIGNNAMSGADIKELKIGNYSALVLDQITSTGDRDVLFYFASLTDGRQALSFTGNAYEYISGMREKYRRTLESIRFKDLH